MNAMVEPLPLVPATWITGGSRRCGSPSAARMRHIRSSDRSMRLGCSCVSRATMESIAVIPTRVNSDWSFRGAGEPAHPESIITVRGYGFRLSPLSRLGRNDELERLLACLRLCRRGEGRVAPWPRASRTSLPRARNRQCVGGRVWSRLGQQPAQIRDGRPQMMAMDDHIDHAVLLEIFGALEAVGEFLADGLLDDARPGKADERTRFGNVDVAEHGIGCGDAPR